MMRMITQAPRYISNEELRKDLRLDPVNEIIRSRAVYYTKRFHTQPNVEAIELLDTEENTRRHKRLYPIDLIDSLLTFINVKF